MELTDNLVSYYSLSGNALDSTSTNDGTNNSVTIDSSNGKIGDGGGFNGSSSYINVANNILGNTRTNFTISMWVRPTSATVDMTFVSDRNTSNYFYKYKVGRVRSTAGSGPNKVQFVMFNGSDVNLFSTSNLSIDTYTFLVVTHEISGSSSNLKIYMNGSLDSSSTVSNVWSGVTRPTAIGRWTGPSSDSYTAGSIDEVGFWDRALSADEVSELYNGGNGLSYPFIPYNPAVARRRLML